MGEIRTFGDLHLTITLSENYNGWAVPALGLPGTTGLPSFNVRGKVTIKGQSWGVDSTILRDEFHHYPDRHLEHTLYELFKPVFDKLIEELKDGYQTAVVTGEMR